MEVKNRVSLQAQTMFLQILINNDAVNKGVKSVSGSDLS